MNLKNLSYKKSEMENNNLLQGFQNLLLEDGNKPLPPKPKKSKKSVSRINNLNNPGIRKRLFTENTFNQY